VARPRGAALARLIHTPASTSPWRDGVMCSLVITYNASVDFFINTRILTPETVLWASACSASGLALVTPTSGLLLLTPSLQLLLGSLLLVCRTTWLYD